MRHHTPKISGAPLDLAGPKWDLARQVAAREVVNGVIPSERLDTAVLRADLRVAEARATSVAAKLQALLEAAQDHIFSLDHELRFTYLNAKARKYFGSRDDLIGRAIVEVFPGADDCDFAKPFLRVLEEGGSVALEAFYPPVGRWYETSVTATDDGVTVFFRDITRRRRTEAALRKSRTNRRQELETTLDGLPAMVWSAHPDGTYDHSNRQWHEFTGIASDAPDKAAAFMALIHPDDLPEFLDVWDRSHSTHAAAEIRYRLRHHSGEYRWVCERAKPERDNRHGVITRWYGTCTDIHEGVMAEQNLARARGLLQTVIDSVSDLIFVKDRTSRFILANRALAQGCGVTIGSRSADRLGTKVADIYEQSDAQVISTGKGLETETNIAVNGEDRLFHTVKVPWMVEGQVAGVIGVSRDVTERARIQGAERAHAEQLCNTLDAIPQMVWSMKVDGTEHYYNEQWAEYAGVRLNGESDARLALVHPDDRSGAKSVWEQALHDDDAYDYEYRMRHHSGEYRWVHSRAKKERSLTGEGYWYGVVSDIHDRKSGELALAESELLHRSILETSSDCINILGPDGSLEHMNAPGAFALEIDDIKGLLGRDWPSLWPREARKNVTAAVAEAQSGRPARFTEYCPTAKGTPKWWDVVVTPMTDETGEVTRILAISRDITSTREAAVQLRWTSEHDSLTDLPNRRLFQAQLEAATTRATETDSLVGLLLIDLDHFKHVNDTLGHAAGDHLLKTFGQRLRSSVRASDVVARLGGTSSR